MLLCLRLPLTVKSLRASSHELPLSRCQRRLSDADAEPERFIPCRAPCIYGSHKVAPYLFPDGYRDLSVSYTASPPFRKQLRTQPTLSSPLFCDVSPMWIIYVHKESYLRVRAADDAWNELGAAVGGLHKCRMLPQGLFVACSTKSLEVSCHPQMAVFLFINVLTLKLGPRLKSRVSSPSSVLKLRKMSPLGNIDDDQLQCHLRERYRKDH